MSQREVGGRSVAIVNPVAGRGRGRGLWRAADRLLTAAGQRFAAWGTEGPGHATELARRAVEDGVDTVLVVGGDGTVNEVAHGVLSARRSAARTVLACLPAGTGNDFARGLGIRTAGDAVGALLERYARAVDVAWARGSDGRPPRAFLNALSVGLGPEVAGSLTPRWRRLGPAAFTLIALATIARYRPAPAVVHADGVEWRFGHAALLVVANGQWAGGGMRLAPPARLDDGLLDLVAVAGVSRLELALRLLPAARRGTHLAHPAVTHVAGRRFRIGTPAAYETDGQVVGAGPVEIWLEPSALRVLARKGVDADADARVGADQEAAIRAPRRGRQRVDRRDVDFTTGQAVGPAPGRDHLRSGVVVR
ncbi:MAG TPA: diacylglycerol kinase family protein [Chloroflexota bacterium]